MNRSFFEDAKLQLQIAANDFKRMVDQQIAAFKKEQELHRKTEQELSDRLLKVE